MEIPTCLSIVVNQSHVLMIEKKRGIGKGYLTFPGGKVEEESPEECAIRELEEEVGVNGYDPKFAGRILFRQLNGGVMSMYVYLFTKFQGEPRETEEAKPIWWRVEELPFDRMWQDDRFWLRKVLSAKVVDCVFLFTDDWSDMVEGYC